MTDRGNEFDGVDITESEGPELEAGDDLQTRLGTPSPGQGDDHADSQDAAAAHEEDQVRSIREVGEDR